MACTALSSDMIKAFEGATTVAFDIEGVDLGRTGQISLVQLASSPTSCFLIDLLNVNKDVSNPLVDWLKCIRESSSGMFTTRLHGTLSANVVWM
jgi:ribonuclease D